MHAAHTIDSIAYVHKNVPPAPRSQAEFTGQSLEQVTMDTDRDFFMSATEAVEYGLIDAVVTKPQILSAAQL